MYELKLEKFEVAIKSDSGYTEFLGKIKSLYFKTSPTFCFLAKFESGKYFLKTVVTEKLDKKCENNTRALFSKDKIRDICSDKYFDNGEFKSNEFESDTFINGSNKGLNWDNLSHEHTINVKSPFLLNRFSELAKIKIVYEPQTESKVIFEGEAIISDYKNCEDAYKLRNSFDRDDKLKLIHSIMSGLRDLCKNNYVYSDLKLENVLVNKNSNDKYEFCLCDFGATFHYDTVENVLEKLSYGQFTLCPNDIAELRANFEKDKNDAVAEDKYRKKVKEYFSNPYKNFHEWTLDSLKEIVFSL